MKVKEESYQILTDDAVKVLPANLEKYDGQRGLKKVSFNFQS